MFSSQVLEVATGFVFVYLTLSTIASGIKEVIAHFLDMRAKTLEEGIRNMLSDPRNAITSKLLQNHLIAGTVQRGVKPSYISSRNFALALFDLIAPVNPGQSRTVKDLENGIGNLPDERVRSTVLALLDSAQQDVDVARQRIENWYDDTMERVSGAYKRRAQAYIAGLGLLLCAAVNADFLMIGKELWNDSALRSAIVAEAQARASSGQSNQVCNDSNKSSLECIREAGVPPIGWEKGDVVRGAPPDEFWPWLFKILGILISAVAVAMGAPFWFDLLNKLVNLRLTGNPPPDSRQSAAT